MQIVKLKDVVMRVKDKIDKDSTNLEYYIGGEHIDSGELCITRKGRIEGSTIGPAFHMHFMPGDVLLMSRNPHLKKAGVVDFEGICSDVSYICRTKDEAILSQMDSLTASRWHPDFIDVTPKHIAKHIFMCYNKITIIVAL